MRVRWTARAERDLEDIFSYIASDDARAARRVLERLGEAIGGLGAFPFAGRIGRLDNTRELAISGTRYIAVYTLNEGTVWVLHVRDGARLWPQKEG